MFRDSINFQSKDFSTHKRAPENVSYFLKCYHSQLLNADIKENRKRVFYWWNQLLARLSRARNTTYISQKVDPSAGCFSLLFLSEHISIRMLCKTFSIPVLRVQFFIAGTLFLSTSPVRESTQPILIFEMNFTTGGTAGYSDVQWILNW